MYLNVLIDNPLSQDLVAYSRFYAGLCHVQLEGAPASDSVRSSRLFTDNEHEVDATVVDPPILNLTTTAQLEDVEALPLQDSQVAAVVTAYDRTIGMVDEVLPWRLVW